MKKNSVKNARINSEVQRILAELLRSEVKDPRIPALSSVTDVEVAPDLKSCKVWVSFFFGKGIDEDAAAVAAAEKDALAGLKSAEGFLKRQLARELNLRITPELRFHADHSISYGNHMSQVLDAVSEADRQARARRGEEDGV